MTMTLKEAFACFDCHETLWMLEKATGLTTTELRLANENTPLSPEARSLFLHMIEQRRHHIPLQYILGNWEFMGLTMECRPGVLIPRGDTEILATEAIRFLQNCSGNPVALDMCTGSGCVGISLAYFCPTSHVTATDIDQKALALATENALNNNVINRMNFVQSNLFEKVHDQFDCITANPPYIPTLEIADLSDEVQQEPPLALDGGVDGLDFYRIIIPASIKYLYPGGGIFLEIGDTQGEAVTEMMKQHNFCDVKMIKDLENRDRVVRGIMK